MSDKILFINFWPKGGMCHYSDATVNVLIKNNEVLYLSNYKSDIQSNNKIIKLSLNPLDINNYTGLVYIIYYLFKIKPKIVHLNSGHPILFTIYPIFYFFNSIVTVHDAIPHKGERGIKILFHYIQLFYFYLFFKKIIVHSDKIKEELPYFINKSKVFIAPHVNYNHLAQTKKSTNKKNNKFKILFFGRILEYKGLKYLVEAFDCLDSHKYELTIAGEGLIDFDVNKENIKVFNRFIDDSEIPDLFNNTDIVVIPYLEASQSGVAYLSFAYSKPVIATDVGSLRDIVSNGNNGFIVKPKSQEELLSAIKHISDPYIYTECVKNIDNGNLSSDTEIAKRLMKIYNI